MVESDAKELLSLIENRDTDRFGNLLFWRIKELFNRNWELCLRFIPREVNKVTDSLAKRGLSSSEFYDVCPVFAHVDDLCLAGI